jgi:plastocyanin
MNRFTWIFGAFLFLVAIAGAAFLIQHDRALAPAPAPEGDSAVTTETNGQSTIITYTDAGFSPPNVTVTPGTTITWSNQSSRKLWVVDASLNIDGCVQGSDALNECAAISAGGTYSYTASAPGTITYANREHREDTGTITVSGGSGAFNPEAVPQ